MIVSVCSLLTSQASGRILPPALSLFTQYIWYIIRASPCSHPSKLSTWQWNTAFWKTKSIQLRRNSSSSCMWGLKSTQHWGISLQSVCCRLLSTLLLDSKGHHSWHDNPICEEAQQPWAFSARPLESPWQGNFAVHVGNFWGGRNDRKLYPRRWKIPSAYLSLFPEVSCLTVASLIPYLQVAPVLSGSLESADLVFMWCLHTLLITSGIILLSYLECAWYMKFSDLCSSSPLLPSFLGSCNFYIFFP